MSNTRIKIQRIKLIRQSLKIMSDIKDGKSYKFIDSSYKVIDSSFFYENVYYMINYKNNSYQRRRYKMDAEEYKITEEICFKIIKDNLDKNNLYVIKTD